jgi:hypothetical protein
MPALQLEINVKGKRKWAVKEKGGKRVQERGTWRV